MNVEVSAAWSDDYRFSVDSRPRHSHNTWIDHQFLDVDNEWTLRNMTASELDVDRILALRRWNVAARVRQMFVIVELNTALQYTHTHKRPCMCHLVSSAPWTPKMQSGSKPRRNLVVCQLVTDLINSSFFYHRYRILFRRSLLFKRANITRVFGSLPLHSDRILKVSINRQLSFGNGCKLDLFKVWRETQ